jgi:transposase
LKAIAMDMSDLYVNSIVLTLNHLPEARRKIVFDKFHICKHLSQAVVDVVRWRENSSCEPPGADRLTGPVTTGSDIRRIWKPTTGASLALCATRHGKPRAPGRSRSPLRRFWLLLRAACPQELPLAAQLDRAQPPESMIEKARVIKRLRQYVT